MEKIIGKSWRTTLIGLCIAGVVIYDFIGSKDSAAFFFNVETAFKLMASFGLILVKDARASHSKDMSHDIDKKIQELENKIVGSRPDDRG